MKRLVGGDFLIDLSALDLSEDVTSEDISDVGILKQLNNLKGFIGKDKNLKPLWVKCFIDGESHDTNIVTRGEIQKIDELTFKLVINLMSFKLIIDVVFEQLQNENNDYIDDYAIDDATYTFTSDASIGGDASVTGDASIGGDASVTGDASIGGDASVTGDVTVGGDIEGEGKITANEIVENMSGYSASKGTEVTDNTCIYCGAVKNGNKLTLVYFCSFYKTPESTGNKTIAKFVVPSGVYDRLYHTTISGQAVLYRAPIICIGDTSADVNTYFYFYKAPNNELHLNINVGALTAGYKYFARFETTFLLSDSLIENE